MKSPITNHKSQITNHKSQFTILLLSFVLCPLSLFAAVRTVDEAAALASTFRNETVVGPHKAPTSAASMQLIHQRTKLQSEEPAFYIFNTANESGYVIVSADDRTEEILGYSEQGSLDYANLNPNMAFWLRLLQEAISATNDTNTSAKAPMATTAIGPLLVNKEGKEITWYQEAPYSNLCPLDSDNKRCLTGCVATAAAQVMYKWCYPKQGIGTHSYEWTNSAGKEKTLTVDYGNTTYDWGNMLPSYLYKSSTSKQKTAVATLMYHAGVACNMQYSSQGSGSLTDLMANGLVDYFGYQVDKFITTYSSRYYPSDFKPTEYKVSITKFTEYFNADLENGYPIIMGGEDSDGGHEFVCDGRDAQGKFHINWGWEGDSNGFFSLSALKVDGYNFSSNIDAIIGLRPASMDTIHVTSVSVSPASTTLKINERKQLTVTIQPTNATDKKVSYTSSNLEVAQVSELGVVRAVGAGKAKITVTTSDGGLTAVSNITVTNEYVPSDIFELVTDASSLQEGDDIIMAATYSNVHYCLTNSMHATTNTNYADCEQVQIVDNTITIEDNSNIAIYKLGIQDGAWTLINADGKKLGALGAKKLSFDLGSVTWTLDTKNNNTTIANTNTSYGRILYNNNNNNPRFSIYTSNTSNTMLLPQVYARKRNQPVEVVKVTGIELGQTSAQMLVDEEIFLYYAVKPVAATNQAVMWTSSNTKVAVVDPSHHSLEDEKTVSIKAIAEGEATITAKTLDGGFVATCVITVTEQPIVPTDTTFIMASEAKTIAMQLPAGDQTTDFYGVKGYVTVKNSVEYQGFWLDDEPTAKETFQGFQCAMPDDHLYLQIGEYVCVYGYLMNYNNEKAQIKNGTVEVLDIPVPQGLLDPSAYPPFSPSASQPIMKVLEHGQMLFLRAAKKYNVLGCPIK